MTEIMNIALYVAKEYNVTPDTFLKKGNHQSDAKHVFRCLLKQYIPHTIVSDHLDISLQTLNYSDNFCRVAKSRNADRFQKIAKVAFPPDVLEYSVHYDAKERKAYLTEPQGIITEKIKLILTLFSKKNVK